jgi:hypothetical protein
VNIFGTSVAKTAGRPGRTRKAYEDAPPGRKMRIQANAVSAAAASGQSLWLVDGRSANGGGGGGSSQGPSPGPPSLSDAV